ncbi:MAG TPA: geranylgeranyl reductase family protein [Candidatus Eremiobacteraeota bacterium]|nr:MAG: putative oxidoreductase [bacterium ADurb.Bin363]HPZ10177.1 geranylgeranyl reductase family protein [Candidatus Eremiobacteraeota bacterium]
MKEKNRLTFQKSIDEIEETLWDVAVIGAGPAGSTLSVNLAGEGHRVLLIDSKKFPREKVCGDLISPPAFQTLARLGLYDRILSLGKELKIAYICEVSDLKSLQKSSKMSIINIHNFLPSYGYPVILKRSIFDTIIAEKAVEKGAVFIKGRVIKIDINKENINILTFKESSSPVLSKIAVIATGSDLALAKTLGMTTGKETPGYALRCYIKSDLIIEDMIFIFDPRTNPTGYAWIFPEGDKIYNAGYGNGFTPKGAKNKINLKKNFMDFLSFFPLSVKLLKSGKIISKIQGGRVYTGAAGAKPVGPGNILAIGDTIGTTTPGSAEGIRLAMLSGERAAIVINNALKTKDFSYIKKYYILLKDFPLIWKRERIF